MILSNKHLANASKILGITLSPQSKILIKYRLKEITIWE